MSRSQALIPVGNRSMCKWAAFDDEDARVRRNVYRMVKTADGNWWSNNWQKPVGALMGGLAIGGIGSLLGGKQGGVLGLLLGSILGWHGLDYLHGRPEYQQSFDSITKGIPGVQKTMKKFNMTLPGQQTRSAKQKTKLTPNPNLTPQQQQIVQAGR